VYIYIYIYIYIEREREREREVYIYIYIYIYIHTQGVQLKSGLYFNISNLFTKIYNMLYYTTNLNLQ